MTGVKKNVPSPLVFNSRYTTPWAWLIKTTLALGTTAPWLSWTTPLIEPDDCCPRRGAVKKMRANASVAIPLFTTGSFILNLQTREIGSNLGPLAQSLRSNGRTVKAITLANDVARLLYKQKTAYDEGP